MKKLCAEFYELKEKAKDFQDNWASVVTSEAPFGFTWKIGYRSVADKIICESLKARMGEIIRLVGQDTLDECVARQRLDDRIQLLENNLMLTKQSLNRRIRLLCGAVVAACLGSVSVLISSLIW